MNNIEKIAPGDSQIITTEQLKPLRDMIAKGATDSELAYFATYANRVGLDPIQKQIHFVVRVGSKGERQITFQTGIDGFRLIAERSGAYAGSDDYLFNDGKTEYELRKNSVEHPTTATSTVYKIVQGIRVAFSATAAWDEYFPGGSKAFMWNKMPFNQLGKCAEAKALRKAFPNLAGLYTDDEMQQANSVSRTNTNSKVQDDTDLITFIADAIKKSNTKEEVNEVCKKYHKYIKMPEIIKAIEAKKEEFNQNQNIVEAEINDTQTTQEQDSELIIEPVIKVEDVLKEIIDAKSNDELDEIKKKYPAMMNNTIILPAISKKRALFNKEKEQS